MSRAFVREPDGDQVGDAAPQRTHSDRPNYITPAGLAALRARAHELATQLDADRGDNSLGAAGERQHLEAELRFLRERIDRAIPVPHPDPAPATIGFGARVDLRGSDGTRLRYRLVGEDEADIASGLLCWAAPLAQAIWGREAGDDAVWQRPAGAMELEIVAVDYPGDD